VAQGRLLRPDSVAGSFGDAAVCLLIMANTSIGTTPVLLGWRTSSPACGRSSPRSLLTRSGSARSAAV